MVERLIALAGHPELRSDLRAQLEWTLYRNVAQHLDSAQPSEDRAEMAHVAGLVTDVRRFLERGVTMTDKPPALPADPPPGSPIGMGYLMGCGSSY